MFILLFCNSQIDLLLGLGLWYFLSDDSLISPLGESDTSVKSMEHSLSVTPCEK